MTDEAREPLEDASVHSWAVMRPACTECRRRKQKCDRQWPCNNCQRRRLAVKCRFKDHPMSTQEENAWAIATTTKRKRDGTGSDEDSDSDEDGLLETIGYSRAHLLTQIDQKSRSKIKSDQYHLDPNSSPQLRRALDTLPPRHIVDMLIQNFLNVVNYYYYIIYPPYFSREYISWWDDYHRGRPCGVQWTCLLLMVCACSAQHVDSQLSKTIEQEAGLSVKQLTQRYHDAARELHSAIPVGYGHVYAVQYLLHSCYWFKAEARFAECWHVLGAVVQEAESINLHKKPEIELPSFELEMKRRLWCIIDSWDWLVSSLLARPMLIDRSQPDIGLPNLTLEDYPVSPMLHLKLQSELVGLIFKNFGPPKLLTEADDILLYQAIMEDFIKGFPSRYAIDHPNTVSDEDEDLPWIALHRHYMHTCTLAIALGPFRSYMSKTMTQNGTPSIELKFRDDGINYALSLMDAVHRFFNYVWTRDRTFHFVPFCIFDTAALLCSVVLHAMDSYVPRRKEITHAINRAFVTLSKLRTATNTAKAPYDVLRRLLKKLPPSISIPSNNVHKRRRFDDSQLSTPLTASSTMQPGSSSSSHDTAPKPKTTIPIPSSDGYQDQNGYYQSLQDTAAVNPPEIQIGQQAFATNDQQLQGPHCLGCEYATEQHDVPATESLVPDEHLMSKADGLNAADGILQATSDAELGDLAMLWNWEGLDLGFTSNPIYQDT